MNHINKRSSWGLKCGIEEDEWRKQIGRISIRGQSIQVDQAEKNIIIKEYYKVLFQNCIGYKELV